MPVSEAEVEALIVGLSAAAGQPAPTVSWIDKGGSHASVRPGRRNLIVLNRRILNDRDDARFTAAHELGHLVLGHNTGRRNGRLAGIYVGTLIIAIGLATAAMLVTIGSTWVSLAPVLGWLLWLPLQRQLSVRLKQPAEVAADLYAARAGAPLTTTLVERYEAEETTADRVAAYLFPLHPSWSDRAAITVAAFPSPGE